MPVAPVATPAPAGATAGPADAVDASYRTKATQAAVKFESFFIGHMLHQMRSGVRVLADEDSAMNNKVNQDMLDLADNLVADQMAGRRAFGVADAILRQLLPPSSTPAASPAAPENASADRQVISEVQKNGAGA
ncbi:hypothetical protein ASF61_08025 [Duganella sp. Leaf126]|nr:hypothetical protein ASF61_08025 [Duganella sp. Leaf126]